MISACVPSSNGSHGMPKPCNQWATTPSVGLNRNSHRTPAMAGATAYGQINSVLYTVAAWITRSARTARRSEIDRPSTATATESTAVTRNDARYSSLRNRSWKLSNHTNCVLMRSEERRVGKECRDRWSQEHE